MVAPFTNQRNGVTQRPKESRAPNASCNDHVVGTNSPGLSFQHPMASLLLLDVGDALRQQTPSFLFNCGSEFLSKSLRGWGMGSSGNVNGSDEPSRESRFKCSCSLHGNRFSPYAPFTNELCMKECGIEISLMMPDNETAVADKKLRWVPAWNIGSDSYSMTFWLIILWLAKGTAVWLSVLVCRPSSRTG